MTDHVARSTSQLMLDLMLEALRVKDERLNAIAIELLGRFGEAPVRRLVLEAASRKNRPAHRLRLLRAIQRIGVVPDPSSYYDLCTLLRDRNEELREAATVVIRSLRLDFRPRDDPPVPPE